MTNLTNRAGRRLLIGAAAVALCFGLAACGPQTPASNGSSGTAQTQEAPSSSSSSDSSTQASTQQEQPAEPGAYVSDEQCLSCHGGSYEALAETTAQYGLSNPHDSIHGGPNACVNCHARDKEITDNQCTHCHDWPHNPESGLGA